MRRVKVDERPTRKMYASELSGLVASERRVARPRSRTARICDHAFAPLERPPVPFYRRAGVVGILSAISGLLAYWFLC